MPEKDSLHVMRHLRRRAGEVPSRPALISPASRQPPHGFHTLTFHELEARTDELAHGLVSVGIGRGVKAILMMRSGEEVFVVLLALLKVGAIPIVVDPGMGVARMLHCYRAVGAKAFIGIPFAHSIRLAARGSFASVEINVTTGSWGGIRLRDLYLGGRGVFELPAVSADEVLMVSFTTGSTGPAKGVEYSHAMIDALLSEMLVAYPIIDGEVGLVTLPSFALIDIFSGCTAVLAPMDPTRPGAVSAEVIFSTIEAYNVRHMFGSPALLKRIAKEALNNRERISSLETLVCGGAAAPAAVLMDLDEALSDRAVIHTTYGATEALPISTVEFSHLRAGPFEMTKEGRGVCVGAPLGSTELRIITTSDSPIAEWSDTLLVGPQEVGEVVISGSIVSQSYHDNREANTLHKIEDGVRCWHRTGDVGWVDEEQRLWLCGRHRQTVQSSWGPLYTMQCEGVFNAHEEVYRSALVAVGPEGAQIPVICVQLHSGTEELSEELLADLQALAGLHSCTRGIEHFIAHKDFPVDIRHNAKIQREQLALWAGAKLGLIALPSAPLWLMAVPVLAWAYFFALPFWPQAQGAWLWVWWLVLFFHLVVHPLEIIKGLPAARSIGHGTLYGVLMTIVFGATYWRPLEAADATELR